MSPRQVKRRESYEGIETERTLGLWLLVRVEEAFWVRMSLPADTFHKPEEAHDAWRRRLASGSTNFIVPSDKLKISENTARAGNVKLALTAYNERANTGGMNLVLTTMG